MLTKGLPISGGKIYICNFACFLFILSSVAGDMEMEGLKFEMGVFGDGPLYQKSKKVKFKLTERKTGSCFNLTIFRIVCLSVCL